jgi:hypothetical protein
MLARPDAIATTKKPDNPRRTVCLMHTTLIGPIGTEMARPAINAFKKIATYENPTKLN